MAKFSFPMPLRDYFNISFFSFTMAVSTRFRYLVAKYFFSIKKKAGFNMALMGGK
jgi:hypothetical protein